MAELIRAIDVDLTVENADHKCRGIAVEFFQGEELKATLEYAHADHIRWPDSPTIQAIQLTTASRDAVLHWFHDHGVSYFLDDFESDERAKRAEAEQAEKFLGHFSPPLRAVVEDLQMPHAEAADAILRATESKQELAVQTCRALGSLDSYWGWHTWKETRAVEILHRIPEPELYSAFEDLKSDLHGLNAIGRLFFRERYAARFSSKKRQEWAVRLAQYAFAKGHDEDKPYVMRQLLSFDSPELRHLLFAVAHRELGRPRDPAVVWDEEPDIWTDAYLTLVQLGERVPNKEIENCLPIAQSKQDKAALEVTLVLLGERDRIRNDLFDIESGNIGLALIKGIERFEGSYGMDSLLYAGEHHPWGAVREEARRAYARMITKPNNNAALQSR